MGRKRICRLLEDRDREVGKTQLAGEKQSDRPGTRDYHVIGHGIGPRASRATNAQPGKVWDPTAFSGGRRERERRLVPRSVTVGTPTRRNLCEKW